MRCFQRLPALSFRRPAATASLLAAAGLCAILAAGCGTRPAPGMHQAHGASPSARSGTHAGPGDQADLTITITGEGAPRHLVLRCGPDGGSYADPAAACRELFAVRHPFAPLPKGIMCPMILAGGKTASITGTFDGTKVDATWPDGGCYLGRWDRMHEIFS